MTASINLMRWAKGARIIAVLGREALRPPHPIDPIQQPSRHWQPSLWASRIPFRQLDNLREITRALHENRDNLNYAWNILRHGVCDGCALGTKGLHDWTMANIHLCNVRLRLLRLNTMPALDIALLTNVQSLQAKRSRDLRSLGRLPYPLIRRHGEPGFQRTSWNGALEAIASRIRRGNPDRCYFYMTSRGEPNENYYAFQKAVRAIGTNNLDNAARICHSPSTSTLKAALGVAATTCSYRDVIGTDLAILIGSNVASNQPVMMKYLYYAKKAGTAVAVINPYREPQMEYYFVPSDLESLLFGTKITDRFFQVKPGGDIPFLAGAAKHMLREGWIDQQFLTDHTAGFAEFAAQIEAVAWDVLEQGSGLSREEMQAFAAMLGRAQRAVFIWGMGITQHTCGEDNVQAIINLALLKGFVGRPGCGLMPIRGHSGVQGGAEMGAYATAFPGGLAITSETAQHFSELWGFPVPDKTGLTVPEMLDVARDGKIDVLFATGGGFNEVMPDPSGVEEVLQRIPLRVHFDIALSSQMLLDPADTVILLPAATRYEMPGGVTETTTERRVIYSPEIPGPRLAEARTEWEVYMDLARRVRPEFASYLTFRDTAQLRQEIARCIPLYDGIQRLHKEGDSFQYGGSLLCSGWQFPTPDGKAHFKTAPLPHRELAPNQFLAVTRRGKQFNSIVQEDTDPINAAPRDGILMHPNDLRRLNLINGDPVELINEHGVFRGRIFAAAVHPGTIQIYWPEGNVLVGPASRSPLAKIPAYKDIVVTIRCPEGAVAGGTVVTSLQEREGQR